MAEYFQSQAGEETNDVLDNFACPITGEVMKDPVMDKDGNTYERAAIEAWIGRNGTSPITRSTLTIDDLRPNRALLDAIEEFKQKKETEEETNEIPLGGDNPDESVEISVDADDKYCLISIHPPEGGKRSPIDICCVVDTSGSMSTRAEMVSNEGTTESHGFSILDLVKHSLRTIIHTLEDTDRLALVSYNSVARQVFGLLQMNEEGKKTAGLALENLSAGGQTNIWGGLHEGMEILRNHARPGACLFLLTDGLPNVIPPRGNLPMLQKYREDHLQLPCKINTFGFGYSLDSQLLSDFAMEGGGNFSFIPDCSLVGTIFVNSLSNVLSNFATNTRLTILTKSDTLISDEGLLGGYPTRSDSQGQIQADLGSLNFGQSKDLVLALTSHSSPYLEVMLEYTLTRSGSVLTMNQEGTNLSGDSEKINEQKFRLMFVDCVRKSIELCQKSDFGTAQQLMGNLCTEIQDFASGNSYLNDLFTDLSGEASLAVSTHGLFNKWGRHYLPSLMQAHLLQQCNNFKDPGVQHYGGDLFNQIRDKADDIFCKLPPPKASIVTRPTLRATAATGRCTGQPKQDSYLSSFLRTLWNGPMFHSGTAASSPCNMSAYHNANNACFSGNSLVLMADCSWKHVKSIIAGDKIWSQEGISQVDCVVETICRGKKAFLVDINGLLVTPFHPIKLKNEWQFPCSVAPVREYDCLAVYSFVLNRNHTIIINGTECITLAHNKHDNGVVHHAYFGTSAVIEDLRKMIGWDSGHVKLGENAVIRDAETKQIKKLVQSL